MPGRGVDALLEASGADSIKLLRDLLCNLESMSDQMKNLIKQNSELKDKIESMSKELAFLSDAREFASSESIWVNIDGVECCSHNDASEMLGYKPGTLANKKKELGLENACVMGKKVYYSKASIMKVREKITSYQKDHRP